MYPAQFDYHRASNIDEAIRLLGELDDAKLIAGGHSLIPMMKLRLAQPGAVVDIGRISDLKGVTRGGDSCRVGALTTHNEIASSEVLQGCCQVLAEAAGKVGDPAVRNKGTIGGNIAHADPASDLPAALLAAGATIHLQGPGGARSVAASGFFKGLLETDMGEDEILTHVEVPCQGAGTGSAYVKFEHPASGYAICGAAAVVTPGGNVSLAFNGVTAAAHAASDVGQALSGSDVGDDAIAKALTGLSIDDPLGDVQASGEYRVQLAKVYGKRAIQAARGRARG